MKANALLILIAWLAISTVPSCKNNGPDENKTPVVQVYDNYLYLSEIIEAMPKVSDGAELDSAALAKNYIDNWIIEQLMLRKAESSINAEELNIDKRIEEYRRSLLIYAYEQSYLQSRVDTNVSMQEIRNYYNNYPDGFVSEEAMVQVSIIEIKAGAPDTDKAYAWANSGTREDQTRLTDYINHFATDYIEKQWLSWPELLDKSPVPKETNSESFVKNNKTVQYTGQQAHYIIIIHDYIMAGEKKPIETVSQKIRWILINKRKLKMIEKLKQDLLQEARDKKYIKELI